MADEMMRFYKKGAGATLQAKGVASKPKKRALRRLEWVLNFNRFVCSWKVASFLILVAGGL